MHQTTCIEQESQMGKFAKTRLFFKQHPSQTRATGAHMIVPGMTINFANTRMINYGSVGPCAMGDTVNVKVKFR